MPGIGRPKGSPKPAGSGRKKGSLNLKETPVASAMRELKFDPLEELIKLHDRLTRFNDQLLEANDYYSGQDILANRQESICKTILPYIHSRKAQEVVQHNINTDVPDVAKARDAIMRAMTRLKTDTPT